MTVMRMAVSTWLYVSRSQLSTAEARPELDFIVSASRRRNHDLEVTGALLFTGARFAQFLEGPPAGLEALRNDIARDSRHVDVMTLAEGSGEDRRFAEWSLAYAGPSQFVAKIIEAAIEDAAAQPLRAAGTLLRLLGNFARQS